MEPIFFSHQNKKNMKWISENNSKIAKNKLISELKKNQSSFSSDRLILFKIL